MQKTRQTRKSSSAKFCLLPLRKVQKKIIQTYTWVMVIQMEIGSEEMEKKTNNNEK